VLITGNVPIATARSNATLGGILERRIFADRPPNLTSSQPLVRSGDDCARSRIPKAEATPHLVVLIKADTVILPHSPMIPERG
jgi:hypothetical protein